MGIDRLECEMRLQKKKRSKDVDGLILYIPDRVQVVVFEEGCGDQLLEEDYEAGNDSYFMGTVVNLNAWDYEIGEIAPDGEQYPFMYDSEIENDEYYLVYDWLVSFYDECPDFVVLRT